MLCCKVCVDEKHQQHAITAIERKCKESQDRLIKLTTKLEKQTIKDLESDLERFSNELKNFVKILSTMSWTT